MALDPQTIGRYVIQRVLGRGAMGVVYLAQDPLLKRNVAIKTMRDGGGGDEQESTMERFKREAEISARLNHPNIITVYDVGVDPGMGPFLAMEYIDGASLASLSRHGLAPEVGLRLLVQAMAGLQASAEAGIVHRDIKPENMLVRRDGRLKLMDFGIARGADSRLTAAGMVFGTPSYTAPELLTGSEASAATDRYAFAVTAFEMFTGRLPFHGSSVGSTLYRIVHEPPAFPDGISMELQLVFAKSFMKDPLDRFENLAIFMLALSDALPTSPEFRIKLHNLIESDETFNSGTLPSVKAGGLIVPAPQTSETPLATEAMEYLTEEPELEVELPAPPPDALGIETKPKESSTLFLEAGASGASATPTPTLQSLPKAGEEFVDVASLAAAALLEDSDSWVAGLFTQSGSGSFNPEDAAPEPAEPRPTEPRPTEPRPTAAPVGAAPADPTPKQPVAAFQVPYEEVEPPKTRPDLHPSTLLEPVTAKSGKRGLLKWLLGLAVIALLAFGVYRFLPGSRQVAIRSTPAGATVHLFGQFLGTTPLDQAKIPGRGAVLKFELEGFVPVTREVLADESQVDVAMEGLPWSTAVRTDPEGAEVLLNDVRKGATPMADLPVPSTGRQVLTLRMKGFADTVITLDKDIPLTDPIVLTPVSFKAAIATEPAGAEILLNGTPRGRTPKELEISGASNQSLVLRLKGYEDWSGRLQQDKPLPNPVPLKVRIQKLSVHSEPAGAAVFMDGKQIGITPLVGLPVPMNLDHPIRLTLDGYQDWNGTFAPGSDLPDPVKLVPGAKSGTTNLPLEPEQPKEPLKKPGFWKRLFGGGPAKEAPKKTN